MRVVVRAWRGAFAVDPAFARSSSAASLRAAARGSLAFGGRCREAGVRPSTGSVGDATTTPCAESFFATLECELLGRRRFTSQAEVRIAIFTYIEGWYNPARRHSSIRYLSPIAYEMQMLKQTQTPSTKPGQLQNLFFPKCEVLHSFATYSCGMAKECSREPERVLLPAAEPRA